jgi:hypothetical protein
MAEQKETLEQIILQAFRDVRNDSFGDEPYLVNRAKMLSAAVRAAGFVQLSENQEAPKNEYDSALYRGIDYGAEESERALVFRVAAKRFLTPDANGEAFRRVKLPKEVKPNV